MFDALRTRTRLLLAFLGLYLVISVTAGWSAWRLIDRQLAQAASDSARRVAGVLAGGGFTLNDRTLRLMQELTGFDFDLVDGPARDDPGVVTAVISDGVHGGRLVEVRYHTAAHARASSAVLLVSALFVVGGAVACAAVSWLLSRYLARPLEVLDRSARSIGDGRLDEPVPVVGGGEVRDLAQTFEVMRCRLQQLDAANRRAERLATLGTFTATIAHEVRNPLSAVRLTVQMLARRYPDDSGLAMITDELERLDMIVDELLAYARGITINPGPCALEDVAADVIRLLRRQAEHAGVTMSVMGAACVQADAVRLRQALLNLVLNAIQAQHGGGAVRIKILADGFVVEDDGPGVAPELRDRLFTPFVSGQSGGTGLGLHLAHEILAAHGARLEYDDQAPGGHFVGRGLTPP